MDQHTEPDEATAKADESEAAKDHSADRPATDREAAAADEQYATSDDATRADVAKHEEEMMKIGVETKGEGAID